MIYTYEAFGLRLSSNLRLPDLLPVASGYEEVEFHLGYLPPWLGSVPEGEVWYMGTYRDPSGEPFLRIFKLEDGRFFWIRYADGTDFVVEGQGKVVWCRWSPELTVADMATYLLNPVMAFVVQLRGITCLHGSVVEIDGQAVCFLGPAKAGKSTTAAAMGRFGCAVLSDDIVALTASGAVEFLVQPGCPGLRLWADSVTALFGSPDALPWITPTWEKRYLDLQARGYRFQGDPLPLGAVYILGERVDSFPIPPIMPLTGQPGLMALVANSWSFHLSEPPALGVELQTLGRVSKSVPLRQVIAHRDPQYLNQLCQTILDDFRALPRPSYAGHQHV